VSDEDRQFGYAKVRDGVLDHHKRMSFAEIAVFHHLLNRANRTSRRGALGLCPGLTGNRLAEDMGKSRDAIQRALKSLEAGKYVSRTEDGIFVHKFNGQPESEVAVKQAGPDHGRPENLPVPAGKPASAGRNSGRSRPGNRPPNRSTGDVGDVGDVMSASKSPTSRSPPKRFWWDLERKRVWGTDEARAQLKAKWLERGLTEAELQAQVGACDRWLEDHQEKRREGSNLANRINNWLNTYMTREQEKATK